MALSMDLQLVYDTLIQNFRSVTIFFSQYTPDGWYDQLGGDVDLCLNDGKQLC